MGASSPDSRGPGTIRMAQRLQEIASQANPMKCLFLSTRRVQVLEPMLTSATEARQHGQLTFMLASELLNAGQNTRALSLFEGLKQSLKLTNRRFTSRTRPA